MTEASTTVEVSRRIAAPAALIFEILADRNVIRRSTGPTCHTAAFDAARPTTGALVPSACPRRSGSGRLRTP
jgi:uncharacterized protein YndB with AHSA1/START domain